MITIFDFFQAFVCFSQTPPMGAAANFAIFTAVGSISSNGTTNVTGDIGTDVGTLSGFPPGQIIGQTNVADATSSQTAIDVDAAYAYLTGVTCDSVIGVTLGGGQTLTPLTYCIAAASTLNGDLILDAQGNPNAIFIIKINGALATGTLSHVLLINSALFSNVYWQVNGLFTLGNQSVFKGTVINNGAISLLDSSSLDGHILSRAGAITLSNNHVSISGNVVLPIELFLFNVSCQNQAAVIKWSTASESKNECFFIEKSSDAIHWAVIGSLAGAGYSSKNLNYSFIDEQKLFDITYYRLKQSDFDGHYKYSGSIFLGNCKNRVEEIVLFPNPSNGEFKLLDDDKKDITGIFIYNTNGRLIYQTDFYQKDFNLSDEDEGIYFLYLRSATSVLTKKIMIEKF